MKFLLLSLLAIPAFATDDKPQYAASAIPAALRTGAHAVLRQHETTFTVKSAGKATERVHLAITILDESGQDHATQVVRYDKLTKVTDFEAQLYDANGKSLKRLKKADIQDLSAVSSGSLFEDNRLKVGQFRYASYPFTVEFDYETSTSNLLFYPGWFPHHEKDLALERADFRVILPPTLRLRFRELNGITIGKTDSSATENRHHWHLGPLPVREVESLRPAYATLGPGVLTAPSSFEVDGHGGELRSWQELGKFLYDLNAGRDELPETLRQRVKTLTAGLTDPAAKVRKVYDYLQQNTRYISIQLGIGGWQTFPAATVAQTGYGDCKALSNYTKAMLKSIGIPSHLAVVRAGDDEPDVLTDFPSVQFNHMILCVPLPKDTLWLECTSQNSPAGYAGSFTGNRHALLVTPEGGKLVQTPRYAATDNAQHRRVRLMLSPEGDGSAEVTTRYTGQQQDTRRMVKHQLGPDDQRQWLYKHIAVPSFDLSAFALQDDAERLASVTETLSLTIRKCASRSGSRLFLTPNLLSAWTSIPTPTARTTEFEIDLAFVDTDTVTVKLPAGLGVEFQPDPVRFDSKFGSYEAAVRVADGTLTYTRRMLRHRDTYPHADYAAYTDFCRKIAKADRAQVVLVKKE
ncbi:MAG: DUF3857 and transglutaminase domain-containing protein [Sphingobacteriaceae bacterium]|nr:DUF3857 and transglutaminase domain-containing protein [Cytophagaceae bacterium]